MTERLLRRVTSPSLWPWTSLAISLGLSLLIYKRLKASMRLLGKAQTCFQILTLPFTRGVTLGKWPSLSLFSLNVKWTTSRLSRWPWKQPSSPAPPWSRVGIYPNLVPSSLASSELLYLWFSDSIPPSGLAWKRDLNQTIPLLQESFNLSPCSQATKTLYAIMCPNSGIQVKY